MTDKLTATFGESFKRIFNIDGPKDTDAPEITILAILDETTGDVVVNPDLPRDEDGCAIIEIDLAQCPVWNLED